MLLSGGRFFLGDSTRLASSHRLFALVLGLSSFVAKLLESLGHETQIPEQKSAANVARYQLYRQQWANRIEQSHCFYPHRGKDQTCVWLLWRDPTSGIQQGFIVWGDSNPYCARYQVFMLTCLLPQKAAVAGRSLSFFFKMKKSKVLLAVFGCILGSVPMHMNFNDLKSFFVRPMFFYQIPQSHFFECKCRNMATRQEEGKHKMFRKNSWNRQLFMILIA